MLLLSLLIFFPSSYCLADPILWNGSSVLLLWKLLVSESRVVCCIILGGSGYSLHQVELLYGDTERGILFLCMFLLENVTQKTGLFDLLLLYFEIQSVLCCFDSNIQTSCMKLNVTTLDPLRKRENNAYISLTY